MSEKSANKSAKIEDVAKAANVSIMSVSRAMRGVEGISQSKRKEILKLARKMGYYPNKVAVSLAASSSNLIGVSVPTLFGTVFSEIYDGMRSRFEKAGFATIIDISDYSKSHEEAWVERMISWQPAGIVLSGVDHSVRTRDELRRAKIPVLEIWDHTQDPIDLCVGIDHVASGMQMGQHLVKLGYKKPAYIGIESGRDIRADRRLMGLQESFSQAGLEFCAFDRISNTASFETGFKAVSRVLSNGNNAPDVMCFLHDNMAFGGLMYCEQNGIDCPENIGIVGYNGLGINEVLKRRITTSITPRFSMGEHGASLLTAKILGANTKNPHPETVIIDPGQTTRHLI
ncbi:LacI family DNA-binding transcriptional regulator [Lentilitoribacter sp. Alg239-R112]|uniref:LacI family DNA-binding transcriptional regulator n=1 Tax=Lentilitoribacter sp. Alg239-R112 TaxID=2305987 RepID=UPI0013A6EDC3|nr:LacI family DNA-binding transcriptional regulator [Lentilitoribacter sp. Alg239-R112]